MAVRRAPSTRGRHALRSRTLADHLVAALRLQPGRLAVDLGAGDGILTAALVRAGARVLAVELDRASVERLRVRFGAQPLVRIVHADATEFSLSNEPFSVLGNIPFAHGTAILRRVLDPRVPLESAVVVVQWRLAAKRASVWPSTLLSTFWGAWHELELLQRLPRCAFSPPPSVDAGVLRFTRRARPLVPRASAVEYERALRRAYEADSLRAVATRLQLRRLAHELGFDPQARPRDLDARQWAEVFGAVVRTTR